MAKDHDLLVWSYDTDDLFEGIVDRPSSATSRLKGRGGFERRRIHSAQPGSRVALSNSGSGTPRDQVSPDAAFDYPFTKVSVFKVPAAECPHGAGHIPSQRGDDVPRGCRRGRRDASASGKKRMARRLLSPLTRRRRTLEL